MVHILLKPGLENFEHYFTSVWDECNCVVVWAFFDIAFLRDLEKAMATHFATHAWKIPWTEGPGRLQSMGLLSRTGLNNFTFTFHFHALEKEMAAHSSTLAWKIPWMEEPGRLQSIGLLRVGHDWTTSLSLFTFMHWRRKWQPTPVLECLENPRDGGASDDGLLSMESHRVEHDWSDLAAAGLS